ncbi:hypothetical protein EJ04DRAFT_565674 [Polyplosphaeria fusca]|uniref:Uncharacterized protein n=1 Tax=Polyplosphaeria fusca TaxID=682080 RepID=A0A9P4QU99_9PLEO|nr:hypothetical protein EJ04DRAFT_565674 [Polyplosphaeria fusca]
MPTLPLRPFCPPRIPQTITTHRTLSFTPSISNRYELCGTNTTCGKCDTDDAKHCVLATETTHHTAKHTKDENEVGELRATSSTDREKGVMHEDRPIKATMGQEGFWEHEVFRKWMGKGEKGEKEEEKQEDKWWQNEGYHGDSKSESRI